MTGLSSYTCVVLSTMCVPVDCCCVWCRPPISAGHCPFRYKPTPLIVSRDPVRRNVEEAGLDLIGFGRSTENRNRKKTFSVGLINYEAVCHSIYFLNSHYTNKH